MEPEVNQNRAVRRYCRQVRSWLPCSASQKRRILRDLKERLNFFSEQGSDYDAIVSSIGTPQTVAAAYVEDLDTGTLLRSLRIRRKIVCIVAVTALVVLISWAATVSWAIYEENEHLGGYGATTPVEIIDGFSE